jgi:predicted O-methyltransferase YrrM
MEKSFLEDRLQNYILSVTRREPPILTKLREETAAHPRAIMQISADEGQFLQLLVTAIGARLTLEIGVFTGYSSLAVALALPPNGKIIACDISEEFTAVARRYWAEAGVDGKIDLRLAPAMDTLDALLSQGGHDSFDFAFIDADKEAYPGYFERCLKLVRPGGLIAIDNTLRRGKVADAQNQEPDTLAIRAFNQSLHHDERILLSLLPMADGITLALKK